jgi:hypothetical protein
MTNRMDVLASGFDPVEALVAVITRGFPSEEKVRMNFRDSYQNGVLNAIAGG